MPSERVFSDGIWHLDHRLASGRILRKICKIYYSQYFLLRTTQFNRKSPVGGAVDWRLYPIRFRENLKTGCIFMETATKD